MKVVSVATMRELDRRTIEERGVPGYELMERAGAAVANFVQHRLRWSGKLSPLIFVAAGCGNNGGDAFVAARHLHQAGHRVIVRIAGASSNLRGDAEKHFRKMREAGVSVEEWPAPVDWTSQKLPSPDAIVDGLLGVGIHGPPRDAIAAAIERIQSHRDRALVFAIDTPSGLDADTGAVPAVSVVADFTITMGLPKRGLLLPEAINYVGRLEVADIGIPQDLIKDCPGEDIEFIDSSEIAALFPPRRHDAHKGHFGHVLLIGGARGYSGAIAMAARGALRAGAGLVTVLTPREVAPVVAGIVPEAMVKPGEQTQAGTLSASEWDSWRREVDRYDAVLIGPGLGRDPDGLTWVRQILRNCLRPSVLDADALNVLEGQAYLIERARGPVVITPHPGELSRLMAMPIETVIQKRCEVAAQVAKATKSTVVLKGAGTLVASVDRPLQICMRGNPGMATGGAGDVLAGMLVGLLGQGLQPYDAARAAVFLHATAGDYAAWECGQASMNALDIARHVSTAFREIVPR